MDKSAEYTENRDRKIQEKLERMIKETIVGTYALNSQLQVIHANERFSKMCGIPIKKIIGMTVRDFIYEKDEDAVYRHLQGLRTGELKETPDSKDYTFRMKKPDGPYRWVEAHNQTDYSMGDMLVIGTVLDVTRYKLEERKLNKLLSEIQLELPNVFVPLYRRDPDGRITDVNKHMTDLLGYTKEEMKAMNLSDLFAEPGNYAGFDSAISKAGDGEVRRLYKILNKDGMPLICLITSNPILSSGENIVGYQGIIQDVTAEIGKTGLLKDDLTGLYTRTFLNNEILRWVKKSDRDNNSSLTIISIDLDGLKITNDICGHIKGDEMLKATANIITNSTRTQEQDIAARMGGDEFALFLPDCDEKLTKKIIARIKENIENYNRASGNIPLHMSIGFAIRKGKMDATELDDFFNEADLAMYNEKRTKGDSAKKIILDYILENNLDEEALAKGRFDRIKDVVQELGKQMGMADEEIEDLMFLAKFQDIGYMAVRKEVLDKKPALTSQEQKQIISHPVVGANILKHSTAYMNIAALITFHHECWNGSGYPEGLKGKRIPLACRVCAVVTAFDSIIHDKSDKKSRSFEEAVEEIRMKSGTQFDPEVVDRFLEIIKTRAAN